MGKNSHLRACAKTSNTTSVDCLQQLIGTDYFLTATKHVQALLKFRWDYSKVEIGNTRNSRFITDSSRPTADIGIRM